MSDAAICEVAVRRMEPADLDGVIALAAARPDAPQWSRDTYRKALDPASAPLRIAVVAQVLKSEELAGFAVATVIAPEAELESIVTTKAWLRRGVARRVFQTLTGELRHAGVQEVWLEVRFGNFAARALYEALGFSCTGRRSAYYAEPVEDAVLMTLQLSGPEQLQAAHSDLQK